MIGIFPSDMFSGIIESTEKILAHQERRETLDITVTRPSHFKDLSSGDSIAINGICLTLERQTDTTLSFVLGHETLQVLGEHLKDFLQKPVNVERSLAFGSRVHGHFVTGHVDGVASVTKSEALGDNWLLQVQVPYPHSRYLLKKGSVALNGVSLTINQIEKQLQMPAQKPDQMPVEKSAQRTVQMPVEKSVERPLQKKETSALVDVCLIPETQKRTNLAQCQVGAKLCFEVDSFVKSVMEAVEQIKNETEEDRRV